MSGQLGEVEIKLIALVEEVFNKVGKGVAYKNGENPEITKDEIKAFLMKLMEDAGVIEAWDDVQFDKCYNEFDSDGSGKVSEDELKALIKRFAEL